MKLAVVGATGLVGQTILQALQERHFPLSELMLVASERSVGKEIDWKGKPYRIISPQQALERRPDIALFSAGSDVSELWAPRFVEAKCRVVDNSSFWRMNPRIKLMVPEVNGHLFKETDWIIANPNCSTIQLVMVLQPLHNKFGVERVVVSTYQSVTGSGQQAVDQLLSERRGNKGETVYPHRIDLNILPHIDQFLDNGYTKEEMKIMQETCKIMADDSIKVTATAVRVPVVGGHSESVNIRLSRDFELTDVREALQSFPGVVVEDKPEQNMYPMPLTAYGKNEVFVGRLRRDFSHDRTLHCWIVADNLRKGAATNAVQIAECIISKFL